MVVTGRPARLRTTGSPPSPPPPPPPSPPPSPSPAPAPSPEPSPSPAAPSPSPSPPSPLLGLGSLGGSSFGPPNRPTKDAPGPVDVPPARTASKLTL
ncbi:hypothetical protein CWS35_11030 [Bradyrhizobium sp. SK17]|nr:hypothetical protein CWS35_11030 [Bradyrhizobium sp. SK17]